MTFRYNNVVPWGRNYDEYVRMFDLREAELALKILGCGDGPASFNYECTQRGGRVVSVDPIYNLTRNEIQQRIDETYADVLRQTGQNQEKFKWDRIKSVAELGRMRMGAMKLFLDSYEQGKLDRKYIPGALPHLPFADNEFDIALSSHFLFLYTDNLSYEFHVEAINEMLRVSREARIFPLLDVNANKSAYVERITADFEANEIEVRKVNYEFQIGGNEVLIIRKGIFTR
ncbi:MAG: SAM-dependent methyltransferase [Anaerolineae bacterium]|nr:SAM-dependent methyltransferase [Anaerolineae bacterium]